VPARPGHIGDADFQDCVALDRVCGLADVYTSPPDQMFSGDFVRHREKDSSAATHGFHCADGPCQTAFSARLSSRFQAISPLSLSFLQFTSLLNSSLGSRAFESQKRKQEAEEARARLTNARAAAVEIETQVRQTVEAPLPGNIRIPFSDLQYACAAAIRSLAEETVRCSDKQ
jgi:hypothetical protein